jgi:hypothetical protein
LTFGPVVAIQPISCSQLQTDRFFGTHSRDWPIGEYPVQHRASRIAAVRAAALSDHLVWPPADEIRLWAKAAVD